MSGKFAKVQKRRRWCDHGLQVPQAYKQLLVEASEGQQDASKMATAGTAAETQQSGQPDKQLAQQLLRFVSIQFTFGEVEELKTSIAAAERLAGQTSATCPSWSASMQLLLELLFLENSRPLHKQLLAFVRKLPAAHQQIIGTLLSQRIQKEAESVLAGNEHQQQNSNAAAEQQDSCSSLAAKAAAAVSLLSLQQQEPLTPAAAQQGLTLAQAAVSLLWLPSAKEWMSTCSPALLLAVSRSVHSTLGPAGQGQHLTPNTMELVQDAISVLYYTLQHQGQYLAGPAGVPGAAAIAAAATCMLEALQGTALVREAMASAAVVVWSAAVLLTVPPAAAAAVFAAGLTPQQLQVDSSSTTATAANGCDDTSSCVSGLQQTWKDSSLLEQLLMARGSCLVHELQRTSPAGRICALKGLLTAMPAEALAGNISAWQQQQQQQQEDVTSSKGRGSRGGNGDGVSFIMHCVLPFATAAARSSPDAHYKFHAVSVVAVALQRAKQLWQELLQQQAAAAAAVEASEQPQQCHGTGAAVQPCSSLQSTQSNQSNLMVAPWLTGAGLSDVVSLLWGHLDEPSSQTLAKVQDAFEALLALLVYQDAAAKQLKLADAADRPGAGSNSCIQDSVVSSGGCGSGSGSVQGFGSWHDTGSFLRTAACAVLAVPAGRKGRYGPLASVLQWVGASHLLQLQPQLVQQVLGAMQDDMVANTATSFFKVLLLQLRREESAAAAPAAAGLQQPQQQQQQLPSRDEQLLACITDVKLKSWCRWWLPSLLGVLWGPDERFRTYVTNHALPVVLQAEPLLLRPIVSMIMAAHAAGPAAAAAAGRGGGGAAQHVPNATAALVVVLKAARKMQLVGDLDTLLPPQQQQQVQSDEPQAAAVAGSSSNSSSMCSPAAMLLSAVSSSSAALRIETLELACVNARSTEPPGELELALARRWLLLCLRCTGAGSRSKSLVMWDKLITRQRAAVAAIRHRAATAKKPGATGGAHPGSLPKLPPNYLAAPGAAAAAAAAAATDADALQRQYAFIQWLSQTLMDSLYPGGPYERKYYALQLLAILLAQWKPTSADIPSSSSSGSSSSSSSVGYSAVMPLCTGLLAPAAVQVLLGCLVDTWDKLRMAAATVLELLPNPLPGLVTPQQLQPLLTWALQLMQSPRVRESDAGARLLRILLVKYVLQLKWEVQLYPAPCVLGPAAAAAAADECDGSSSSNSGNTGQSDNRNNKSVDAGAMVNAAVDFLSSLTGQLRSQLSLAQSDMTAASKRGLVHGTVLTLRYAVDEMPWAQLTSSGCTVSAIVGAAAAAAESSGDLQQQQQQQGIGSSSSSSSNAGGTSAESVTRVTGAARDVLRVWMADLLSLLVEATRIAQPYLSAQDLNMAADEVEEDEQSDDEADLPDDEDELQPAQPTPDREVQPGSTATLSGPAIQLLITACWTSVKEISLLIGTLTRRLPLPGGSGGSSIAAAAAAAIDDSSSSNGNLPAAAAAAVPVSSSSSSSRDLLQPHQLAEMGDMLLSLLLTMKHNGAVEKSQPGFLWLSEQLLQSPKPLLNSLPGVWLEKCLARVQEPGQCRDDIVRRSAGLPFAISCLFLSEPHGVPRQLLPNGLEQLLEIATDESLQEPWPRVHAFNCLRCIFNDAAMALDTSGFHAAGVAAAVQGMAAHAWEVRNAAALTFTALVTRVIGYKNAGNKQHLIKPLQQLAACPAALNLWLEPRMTGGGGASSVTAGSSSSGSSSSMYNAPKASWCVKSPTATNFFYRYPQLHGFLLEQLQAAAQLLGQAGSSSSSTTGDNSSSTAGQGSEVPPSLFPVLVILSRLKPSLLLSSSSIAAAGEVGDAATAAAATADLTLSPVAFIPAVLAVGRSSMMGVRQIAAASLAPLVAADQLHATCLALADQLPRKPWTSSNAAAAPVADGSSNAEARLNHNALHGALLQLTALLRAVASSSSGGGSSSNSGAQIAGLVAELLPAFLSTTWLASSDKCSSAVRQAYVAAAGQLVMLAYINWQAVVEASSSSSSSGIATSAAAMVAVQQLQHLVSDLRASCFAAVQQTVLPTESTAAGGTSTAAAAAAGFTEASDPQHCCWLRDCTALLLGHLLRMQLLLQQYDQQQQQQGTAAAASPLGSVAAAAYVEQLLPQLQQLLQTCMSSSAYEVRASAVKAAAVQLDHVLQLCPDLPTLFGSSRRENVSTAMQETTTAAAAAAAALGSCAAVTAVQQLQQHLWAALETEKTIKVLKRLLVVLGQLQQLQQAVEQQQQQQCTTPAAAAVGGDASVLRRLRASLSVAKQYKQLDVRIAALKCAAQELQPAITAVCNSTAADWCTTSSSSSSVGGGGFCEVSQQYVQHMQQLLQLLQTCSLPSQQEEIREAAAEALQLSRVLWPLAAAARRSSSTGSTTGSTFMSVARLSLSAWSVALRLMEDEEDMVRQPAANAALQILTTLPAVQPAAQPAVRSITAADGVVSGAAGGTTGSTGQYVEAVERYTFDLLARCSSWLPELLPDVLQLLTNVIFEPGTAVPEVLLQQCRKHERAAAEADGSGSAAAAAGSSSASATAAAAPAGVASPAVLAGILVRRLFEKEADNHHEEQVLLAQHAAAALYETLLGQQQQQGELAGTAPAAAVKHFLSTWCQTLIRFLTETLSKMSAVSSNTASGWIGGDTNHPEVFVPLYRCLLGLVATAPYWKSTGRDELLSQQQQQGCDATAAAATAVRVAVQHAVSQLLQLQPTVLLLPVLQELQELCSGATAQLKGSLADGDVASSRVLFLAQRE